MPSRTSTSTRRTSTRRTSDLSASGPSKPWRGASAPKPDIDDDMASDNDENNPPAVHGQPRHLDEPWAYTFQPNDRVWIRNHGKWIKGSIFPGSIPKVGSNDNLTYFSVVYRDNYGHKLRKYFAPLLGELKPDTAAVQSLLREAHWI
ncbi:hypothetical protein C8F04DRAFT_1272045 [Mycena alexandri]|uniref:Uncharacterized protein n=1 Tax=Mycena alexandri TaxID=1745969 RepID=A0AAD6S8S2_9AGAR|nr:hypothetical protein C8F04DRAFT_1275339 [Mycena alexandri]KAJ7022979.1 hypothetical protein C8F04DRAFT_1272045 [Mycena alexandri]